MTRYLFQVAEVFACVLCALMLTGKPSAQQPAVVAPGLHPPLTVEQVVKNLEEKNRDRTAALRQLEGTRVYRMAYHGFLGARDAEMVVSMHFKAPDDKEFTVVSQSGSKFIIDHVFKKLLDSEKEAADAENRRQTALGSENYDFTLESYEPAPAGGVYVLNTIPKSKNKFLYDGKIWVDAKDFAVVRIEASPAKNPSFWIKKTAIEHRYTKVDDFWLPAENHTESFIRLGGKAVLSIEYKDYKITDALPLPQSAGVGEHGCLGCAPLRVFEARRNPLLSDTVACQGRDDCSPKPQHHSE
jgi:hypothetical protein